MTTITAPELHRTGRWSAPSVAAGAYVAAWLVGLTAFPAAPSTGAGDAELIAHIIDHRASTAIQSVLVHGVAAVALLLVLVAVDRTGRTSRIATTAGLVGVALSLGQLALGLIRSLVAEGTTIATLADAIDRVDGLKIVAFAVLIGAAAPALHRAGLIGRRMHALRHVSTAVLAAAGVAYLLDVEPLLGLAAPALVLLLLWVARMGAAAARAS